MDRREEEDDQRCPLTTDLEEIIDMKKEGEFTHVRGEAIYESGRVETFEAELKKDGMPPQSFSKKLSDLRSFPKVKEVKTEKYNEDA